jgi:hypothetical protein
MMAGEEPVEECGPDASDMQGAGGAGGETDAYILVSTHGAAQLLQKKFCNRIIVQTIALIKRKLEHGHVERSEKSGFSGGLEEPPWQRHEGK